MGDVHWTNQISAVCGHVFVSLGCVCGVHIPGEDAFLCLCWIGQGHS